jgi:hypothetical protein
MQDVINDEFSIDKIISLNILLLIMQEVIIDKFSDEKIISLNIS